jgi:Uncharacterized protein conserved in bacteria (DUF2330)
MSLCDVRGKRSWLAPTLRVSFVSMHLRVWISSLALTLGFVDITPAHACAPAPPEGAFVQIAEETALIVWEPDAKREHFIRRGAFRTRAKDFGFLVPTPDKPELNAVPETTLSQFEEMTRPKTVNETQYRVNPVPLLLWPFFMFLGRSAPEAALAPVRVLDAKRIAGYDAVVLEADDANALADWLKTHGYDARPALRNWLRPYVEAHWKITAFKIVADGQTVETDAIRMTFTTDKPVYPYREPTDQRENLPPEASYQPRLLRVFFLGTQRVDGTVGTGAFGGEVTWAGPVKTSVPLPFATLDKPWLTVFEDTSSPRPGTDDLFFAPSKDQAEVRPPPIVIQHDSEIPVPLDVVAVVAIGAWRIKRRRAKKESRDNPSENT